MVFAGLRVKSLSPLLGYVNATQVAVRPSDLLTVKQLTKYLDWLRHKTTDESLLDIMHGSKTI